MLVWPIVGMIASLLLAWLSWWSGRHSPEPRQRRVQAALSGAYPAT